MINCADRKMGDRIFVAHSIWATLNEYAEFTLTLCVCVFLSRDDKMSIESIGLQMSLCNVYHIINTVSLSLSLSQTAEERIAVIHGWWFVNRIKKD